jgi:hypothetical protein
MQKKYFRTLLITVCLALPVVACAWTLNTWVKTGGGTLQIRTAPLQTSTDGSVFNNYTSQQNFPVTISANPGNKIGQYTVNGGTAINPPTSIASFTYQMGQIAFPGVNNQSFVVSFLQWMTPITVKSSDSGGTVSPSGLLSLQLGTSRSYTFTPGSGNQIIAIDGLPASGYTLAPPTLPASINTPVTLTLTIPENPLTITGHFLGVIANAGALQTVLPGSNVTLDGSDSSIKYGGGTLSYAWSQTDGPAVTLSATNVAKPTFTASTLGNYNFQLVVSNGTYSNSANTTVGVVSSALAAARTSCQTCHDSNGKGAASNVFGNWSSSSHRNHFVMCHNCHVGTNSGGHPGSLRMNTVSGTTFTYNSGGANFCFTCHHKGNNLHFNTEVQLVNICVTCHNPNVHNPAATMSLSAGSRHFNGYTSSTNPGYRAAYVTPTTQCSNCHITAAGVPNTSDAALQQQRLGWAASGHANTGGQAWLAYDFKAMSGCVQCHTTAGFIAYSTARVADAWGSASITRDVLSCVACHTDISSGALRDAFPLKPYADDAYTNPNVGNSSNLCLKCHSGTQSGRSIKAKVSAGADFTNLAFIGSHSSAAAGILFKSIGYEFTGQEYSNKRHFKHDKVGINGYTAYGYNTGVNGPCVACHMSSPNKHTFSPLSKDVSGVVTAITSPVCAGCHSTPAYLDANRMNSRESRFAVTLLAFQKLLESKNIFYNVAPPYFFKSPDNPVPANAVTNWGNADIMGSAFNFNLLRHEPGAYAHNMIYSKRLIYDSMDFLDNGLLDNSVVSAINNLPGLDTTQKVTAIGYLAPAGTRP